MTQSFDIWVCSNLTFCRICDMSWNPYLTSEVAFMCEDGSLRYVDASSSAPGSVNDLYPLVIKEGLTPKGATLRCCWSNHPRLLYYIVGMQLPPCSSSGNPDCSLLKRSPRVSIYCFCGQLELYSYTSLDCHPFAFVCYLAKESLVGTLWIDFICWSEVHNKKSLCDPRSHCRFGAVPV